jgi:hypothetical protein
LSVGPSAAMPAAASGCSSAAGGRFLSSGERSCTRLPRGPAIPPTIVDSPAEVPWPKRTSSPGGLGGRRSC